MRKTLLDFRLLDFRVPCCQLDSQLDSATNDSRKKIHFHHLSSSNSQREAGKKFRWAELSSRTRFYVKFAVIYYFHTWHCIKQHRILPFFDSARRNYDALIFLASSWFLRAANGDENFSTLIHIIIINVALCLFTSGHWKGKQELFIRSRLIVAKATENMFSYRHPEPAAWWISMLHF